MGQGQRFKQSDDKKSERRKMMSGCELLQDLTGGQINALLSKICGNDKSVLQAILRDEVGIELISKLQKLFDRNGRRIPDGLKSPVSDPNWDFHLEWPMLDTEQDYNYRLNRLYNCFGSHFNVSGKQLMEETERLLTLIRDNPQVAGIVNLTKGIYLPVVLPQMNTYDIGAILEQFLEAVEKSYLKAFPNRVFDNIPKGDLKGNINITTKSCNPYLFERLEKRPVMGIYFPNCLQGFTWKASLEQMSSLPEGFVLSGLDIAMAMTMYPDILACGFNAPSQELNGLSWTKTYGDYPLYFWAHDNRLVFDFFPGRVNEGACSSGLLFIG